MIVLFHMGVSGLSGGFVGVDVFFVISGYLITGVLLRDLAPDPAGRPTGRIAYGTFYLRRLRRLGPALIVTLAGTLVAGYLLLPPEQYAALGKSAVAALFSVSNLLFWAESGYFDTDAILKPLLHTWSLGVEEQVYLVWPVALALLTARFGLRGALAALVGLALASLIGAEALMTRHPSAVFFLMPFRIAEFALGAWLAMTGSRARPGAQSHAASVIGLVLILGAALLYDKATRFPGLSALVPAAGAALVIWAAPGGLGNRLLLLEPVRYIGRISYSLYLVHWPVVSLYAFRRGAPETWTEVAGLTAIVIVLGTILYHLVETPFRRTGPDGAFRMPGRRLGATMAVGAVLVTFAGTDIVRRDGYGWRTHDSLAALERSIRDGKRERRRAIRQDSCHYSSKNPDYFAGFASCLPPRITDAVVVLGDSHAADLWAALSRTMPDRAVVQLTAAGCALSRPPNRAERCDIFFDHARDWLDRNHADIAMVIYSQRAASAMQAGQDDTPTAPDPEAVERLGATLADLSATGLPIAVWGPRPEFHPVIDVVLGRSMDMADFLRRMEATDLSPYAALDQALRVRISAAGLVYLSSYDVLCPQDECRYLDDRGRPLIVDYGHWDPDGGAMVVGLMAAVYPALARFTAPEPDRQTGATAPAAHRE